MVTWSGHNSPSTLSRTFDELKSPTTRIRHSNKIKSSPLPTPKYRISIKLQRLLKLGPITRSKRSFMQKKSANTLFWKLDQVLWEFSIRSLWKLMSSVSKRRIKHPISLTSPLIRRIKYFVLCMMAVHDIAIWNLQERLNSSMKWSKRN